MRRCWRRRCRCSGLRPARIVEGSRRHRHFIGDPNALYDHLDGQEAALDSISLADAKAHLSELIDKVGEGHAIDITRRGKPVARLVKVATPRKPIDIARLQSLTAAMPPQAEGAAELVRTMRDGDRY